MNIHDATEQAYKNGYEQGLKDAVKHGRWEVYFDGKYLLCSACKSSFWDENGDGGSNYCPHCGAKMDLPEPYSPDISRDQWEDKARFE